MFGARRKAKERARATKPALAGWRVVGHKSAAAADGLLQEQAWTLWHRFERTAGITVLRHNDEHFRKFSYWGAWDGRRLARVKDLALLRQSFPQVYAWPKRCAANGIKPPFGDMMIV